MTTPVRRRPATLVSASLAAGALLVLASCSDGGGGEASEPTAPPTTAGRPTTTAPPATTAAPTTLAPTTVAPTSTTEVPSGDAFYVPPDPLPAGEPGDLLRARPFARSDGSQGWQILYLSEDLEGRPTAVSGTVLAPAGAAPAGGRPVVTWANGTVGLADKCAESKRVAKGEAGQVSLLGGPLLARDMVVVATDYQGIGTPGVHPYLVGGIEGRNVLDAARAVEQLPETGATATSPVLIWGHSQGGHAAAFAAELAPTYAPELQVKGAALGAPPGDLTALLSAPTDTPQPFFGFFPMIIAGFEAGYPATDFSPILTEKGVAAVATATEQCVGETIGAFAGARPSDYLTAAATGEPMGSLLTENSAGRATSVPLFVYHGSADNVVNPASSELMQQRYCAAGVTSERKVYPDADHTSVLASAANDLVAWFTARLAGQPAASTCPAG